MYNPPPLWIQASHGVTQVTAWPSALTVVATWDRDLMQQYGMAMGWNLEGFKAKELLPVPNTMFVTTKNTTGCR